MLRNLTAGQKAGTFGLLVIALAVLAARSSFVSTSMYMAIPTVATLLMMLVVTGEGYSREGWQSLGLVLATGLATYGLRPEVTELLRGLPMPLVVPLLLVTNTLTNSLGEELGWRGYLLVGLWVLRRVSTARPYELAM